MRRGSILLLVLLLPAAAPGRPAGLVDERPVPPGMTKLGTKDGHKIEPLGADHAPDMPAIRPGGTWLRPPGDRLGVHLGYDGIGQLHYLTVAPHLDVLNENLWLSLGAPLRVEVLDPAVGPGLHGVRSQDWNELGDVERLVNELRWRTGDFSLHMSRFERTTLGEGTLLRDHDPNLFIGSARLATLATLEGEHGGGQLYLDDLADLHVLAARAFVRPFSGSAPLPRTLTLALTFAADVSAPRALDTFATGVPRTRQDGTFVVSRAEAVTGGGITLSSTVVDTPRTRLTPFVDHSCIGGRGCGQTAGATLSVGAVDLRLELRRFDAGYLPVWFDAYYEAARIQLVGLRRGFRAPPKYAARSADGGGSHVGYLAGVTWAIPGLLTARLSFENADTPAAQAIVLHGEVPVLSWLQAIATLERRNLSEGSSVFQLGGADTTGYLGARVRTDEHVYLNLAWSRRFTVNRALGQIESESGAGFDVELTWGL